MPSPPSIDFWPNGDRKSNFSSELTHNPGDFELSRYRKLRLQSQVGYWCCRPTWQSLGHQGLASLSISTKWVVHGLSRGLRNLPLIGDGEREWEMRFEIWETWAQIWEPLPTKIHLLRTMMCALFLFNKPKSDHSWVSFPTAHFWLLTQHKCLDWHFFFS